MKRSVMVKELVAKGLELSVEIQNSPEYENLSVREYDLLITDKLLAFLEEQGMLPPPQECKLVPDHLRGGVKHSECKRVWDEE